MLKDWRIWSYALKSFPNLICIDNLLLVGLTENHNETLRIKINQSHLTDAPYSESSKEAFYFESDDHIVDQLILSINHARPSAYLISGYRGTGKTSLLNRVFVGLKDSHLCVTINLARYDGYPRLIKNLIRQLYLKYEASPASKNKINAEMSKQFQLLYDRTFHDIVNSKLTQTKKEDKIEHKLELNWKKVVPYFFILLGGMGLAFGITSNMIGLLTLAGGVLWSMIGNWTTTGTDTGVDSESTDLSWKSLYDDEIAEHYLFGILKELQDKGIKVLLAFDELDKLETKEEITKLVNDLKPLLLSGLTRSFVIAGQSLFYDYEKSAYQDDRVISTLFSKMIHVSFLKNAALKKFCFGMVKDDTAKQSALLDHFFDAVILKSSRIPRKLVNLISDKLQWDKEQAYIELSEEDEPKLEIASALLGVLANVMDRDLPPLTNNPVQLDFFIFQIHLWLFKIQQTSAYFKMGSIIDDESYKQFPEQYRNRLRAVADVLTDGLLQAGFLKLKVNEDPETLEDEFLWIESPVKPATGNNGDQTGGHETPSLTPLDGPTDYPDLPAESNSLEQPVFLMQYGALEQYVRELYISVAPSEINGNKLLSLRQMVNRLSELSVLKKSWYKTSKIEGLINTRNKLAHGQKLEARELDVIAKSAFELSRLRAEINEDFAYYVSREVLQDYKFNDTNGGGFDFIGEAEDHLLAFDVKTSVTGKPDNFTMNEIMDKFSNLNLRSNKKPFYILFYFLPNKRKSLDEFYLLFNERLKAPGFTYKNQMHMLYITEGDPRGARKIIEDYLKSIIPNVNIAES